MQSGRVAAGGVSTDRAAGARRHGARRGHPGELAHVHVHYRITASAYGMNPGVLTLRRVPHTCTSVSSHCLLDGMGVSLSDLT